MSKPEEMWFPIIQAPDYYISNHGRVLSTKRGKPKFLRIYRDDNGYYWVALYINQKRIKMKTSRLVAKYFIPNPDNLPTVDHIDRDTSNNCVTNLRWASYKEQHKNRSIAILKGEQIGTSIWTEEQVKEIKKLHKEKGLGKKRIAKLFSCTPSQAQSAISGWKHLD